MSTDTPILCTLDEAAEALGIDESLLAVKVLTGAIKPDLIGAGKRVLFHRKSLPAIAKHFPHAVIRDGITTKTITLPQ